MNDYLKRCEIAALEKGIASSVKQGLSLVLVDVEQLQRLLQEVKKRRFQASSCRKQRAASEKEKQ